MFEQRRAALAIAHPVGGDRGAVGQEFFDDDETIELAASMASVFLRPGESEKSGYPELFGKRWIVLRQPGVAPGNESASLDFVCQERTKIGSELFCRCRQGSGREGETSHPGILAESPLIGQEESARITWQSSPSSGSMTEKIAGCPIACWASPLRLSTSYRNG